MVPDCPRLLPDSGTAGDLGRRRMDLLFVCYLLYANSFWMMIVNKIESERSSKDNEERGRIEEGAHKNLVLVSSLISVSAKRSSTASTELIVLRLLSFLDIIFWIFLQSPSRMTCYPHVIRLIQGPQVEELS